MPKRNLDRERLEVYFLTILLIARPVLLLGGLILLIYALAALPMYPVVSGAALLLAVFLILLAYSYRIALYLARIGARLTTLGKHQD